MTAPSRVPAQHQSLLHFVGNAPWSDVRVLAKVRESVLPSIERSGPIEAWIVDDTGIPTTGRHSVAVPRQYCGTLGKQDTFPRTEQRRVGNEGVPQCRFPCSQLHSTKKKP